MNTLNDACALLFILIPEFKTLEQTRN